MEISDQPRNTEDPDQRNSFSSINISSVQQPGKILGTAYRTSSTSNSAEPAYRTPQISNILRSRSDSTEPCITDPFIADSLRSPDLAGSSSTSRLSSCKRPPLLGSSGARKSRYGYVSLVKGVF